MKIASNKLLTLADYLSSLNFIFTPKIGASLISPSRGCCRTECKNLVHNYHSCHCQPLLLIINIITVLITCPIPVWRKWVIGSWYWVGQFLGCPLDGAGAPATLGRISARSCLCEKVAAGQAWALTRLFMGQKPYWKRGMSRKGGDRSAIWGKCNESHQVCHAVENWEGWGEKAVRQGWNLSK